MIRVVVVDDEPAVLECLSVLLNSEEDLEVVGTAADGAEALNCVDRVRTDVVLMDLKMPGMDGITATRRLTANEKYHPAVLALTTFATEELALAAIRSGAAGFCAKADHPEALGQAVRTVAKGDAVVSPTVLRTLLDRLVRPVEATEVTCSPRELEVLAVVSEGATNAEVSDRLFISDATVRTHLRHLREKFGARNRAELVVRAWERGLNRATDGSATAGRGRTKEVRGTGRRCPA